MTTRAVRGQFAKTFRDGAPLIHDSRVRAPTGPWIANAASVFSNQPFEVTEGKKVVEVRLRGVTKALMGRRVTVECGPSTLLVAIGDDRTDEQCSRTAIIERHDCRRRPAGGGPLSSRGLPRCPSPPSLAR